MNSSTFEDGKSPTIFTKNKPQLQEITARRSFEMGLKEFLVRLASACHEVADHKGPNYIISTLRIENDIYFLSKFSCDSWNALSAREKQVAAHVGQGKQNKEIAIILGISPATVGVYMHRINSKLSLNSRVDLAIYSFFMSRLFEESLL